jgi:signal transduction histidine kinase
MDNLEQAGPAWQELGPHFPRSRQWCGAIVTALGALGLLSWKAGWRTLRTVGADSIPMAPDQALSFVLLGTSLWLLARTPVRRWVALIVCACAGLVAFTAILRLGEFIPGNPWRIDQWRFFASGDTSDPVSPDHDQMALQTAATFILGSLTLFLLTLPGKYAMVRNAASLLAVIVASLGLIFALGYFYGAPFFSGPAAIPMAINTSLSFITLGVGLLVTAGPDTVPLRPLLGPSVHARLLRAFLPSTMLTVCVVAWSMSWLTSLISQKESAPSAALVAALLVVAALLLVSFICARIAGVVGGDLERAEEELREAEGQSRQYAEELQILNASLEKRVVERTTALEVSRDHLEQFFTIITSLENPDNVEKTFDLVLGFCQRLGYEQAMISLVDRDAKVIRAVKAVGAMTEVLAMTVRPLEGNDVLAVVAREGRTAVISDSRQDERCDPVAVAAAGIHGQIVIPLLSQGDVLGTLQVGSRLPLAPTPDDVRTLETLGSQAARALAGLLRLKEIQHLNRELEQTAAELTSSNQQLHELAVDLRETAASERRAHEELKKAQSQLVQSEKLAALGQLVAGVAHEINNPLSFVSNNVAVLQRDVRALRELLTLYQEAEAVLEQQLPGLRARVRELEERIDLCYTLSNLDGLVDRSREGLKRIQQIVKDLRDFARLDESDLHEVDLNAGIRSTINIIQGEAKKEQITLELELEPLPPVLCYPAKVNQVILNLVTNALDACSQGGKVTIGTRALAEGVEITVADNGSGIDPAIREKIFDPFFTTKPQGKGTGLGLSISYGIVQAHGGSIDFDSTLNQGSCFKVRFPRGMGQAAPRNGPAAGQGKQVISPS